MCVDGSSILLLSCSLSLLLLVVVPVVVVVLVAVVVVVVVGVVVVVFLVVGVVVVVAFVAASVAFLIFFFYLFSFLFFVVLVLVLAAAPVVLSALYRLQAFCWQMHNFYCFAGTLWSQDFCFGAFGVGGECFAPHLAFVFRKQVPQVFCCAAAQNQMKNKII